MTNNFEASRTNMLEVKPDKAALPMSRVIFPSGLALLGPSLRLLSGATHAVPHQNFRGTAHASVPNWRRNLSISISYINHQGNNKIKTSFVRLSEFERCDVSDVPSDPLRRRTP